ncbi:28S ribosomal protein S33, mitochondrial [Anthonomus grandis grandis]|uniref:28S ribosomal protein S33, mitochondrial n=1 Tax=Anthonomus grandis grandis TaxID=2921223 RepID=UPI00216590BC|nr:28S ribosomal protein S33, mitochondrial [Anthonomus grandis grandis]
MTNYVKYTDLIKVGTEYARRMNRLSNRIFGEPVQAINSKSLKVIKILSEQPVNLRKEIHAYYPRHIETGKLMMKLRYYGLYRDEHQDFKDEMERMRALRGKAKPKRQPRSKQNEEPS